MTALNEEAAEEFIAAGAFTPGLPGFVGIAVDLLLEPGAAKSSRRPLRHGFLDHRGPHLLTVSGPPSPGLEVALRRMSDDLAASLRIAERDGLTVLPLASDTAHPDGPAHMLSTATAGVRVGLEAGLDGGGPLGLRRRWALAHTLAPVLAAAFANSPLRHGRPTGWRSVRTSLRRDLPVCGGMEPRAGWAAYVMDARTVSGRTLREWMRAGGRPGRAEVRRHGEALRPPVAARGHLELDVADRQPGDRWRLVAAVTAVLLDDARAAEQAWAATAALAGEQRLWERAARDALTDPVLAAAARDCFLAAYAALARQGAARELRDALAEFTERYVHRGRCPADDVLDQVAARP